MKKVISILLIAMITLVGANFVVFADGDTDTETTTTSTGIPYPDES